jgi:hypothetical protein
MDHPQTPRILAPHLQQFQYRIVRILGKVVQLHGETAVIDAGGNVDLILNRVRRVICKIVDEALSLLSAPKMPTLHYIVPRPPFSKHRIFITPPPD